MRSLQLAAVTGLAVLMLTAVPNSAADPGGGGAPSMGGGDMSSSRNTPRYDAAAEYRKGVDALQAKNYKGALTAFKRVLTVAPNDANANYLTGLASVGSGDDKRAVGYFQKAIKYNDALIAAHRDLGLTRARLNDRKGATAQRDLLQKKFDGCTGRCPPATASEIKAAVEAIEAALAPAPQAARNSFELPGAYVGTQRGDLAYFDSIALINERRYDEAIASLEVSRAIFGPHPDILTYIGFANRKLGRFDAAQSYYRAALAVAPMHRGALEYQGELKVERGDLAGARANLALLERACIFGCYEAEELRRWIAAGRSPTS